MSEQVKRTVPVPSVETKYFWERCHAGELVLERCTACGNLQFYPRSICDSCFSNDVEWVPASGQAEVISLTVIRRAFAPAFADKVPYVVALVRLAEGPQMMTHIVGCPPEDVNIGMPVEVEFDPLDENISLPVFKPR